MTDRPLTAAGGWCAPSDTIYDLAGRPVIDVPEFTVARGGITFDTSPEARAAAERNRTRVDAIVRRVAKRQHAAIETACAEAIEHGWDVHIYRAPYIYRLPGTGPTPYIGIEFTPATYPVPTIHEHHHDATYDWDD